MPKNKTVKKRKNTSAKKPFTLEQVEMIRSMLINKDAKRDLCLLNLSLDTLLRGCDVLDLRIEDLKDSNGNWKEELSIDQNKTGGTVDVVIDPETVESLEAYAGTFKAHQFLFPGDGERGHIHERHFIRLVQGWAKMIGLPPENYGTHSLRKSKAAFIYKETGNLRAVQILLGHKRISTTTRYIGVEKKDALSLSRQYRM